MWWWNRQSNVWLVKLLIKVIVDISTSSYIHAPSLAFRLVKLLNRSQIITKIGYEKAEASSKLLGANPNPH